MQETAQVPVQAAEKVTEEASEEITKEAAKGFIAEKGFSQSQIVQGAV